ncbi:hypothetical protein LRP88_11730 [Fusarium phalaenopsidis]
MNGRRPQPRPYRSKRHRPCDVCRRRKHACHFQDQPPCTVCQELGTECTFNEPPTKRRRQTRLPPSVSPETTGEGLAESGDLETAAVSNQNWPSPSPAVTATPIRHDEEPGIQDHYDAPDSSLDAGMLQPSRHDIWSSVMLDPELGALSLAFSEGFDDINIAQDSLFPVFNQLPIPEIPNESASQAANAPQPGEAASQPVHYQSTQALDSQDGSWTAQYFGLSGETDPFLLRHMRFSEEGSCNFGQFQYRCVDPGTMSTDSDASTPRTPIHFIINAPRRLAHCEKDIGRKVELGELRSELNRLVDPELGARLVGLFLRYIFPNLPVISRSQLKVRTETLVPKSKQLECLPPYLLAAIYAAADQFRRYDPALNVSQTDREFPKDALWKMAYQSLVRFVHVPQLATVQTLLIYLQRPLEEATTASADSPGHWPLLGSTIHLANQQGLHLECSSWPIPDWEKRLRRRLWWVIYGESTWRSLVLGLPQSIQKDQWDVGPLSSDDFIIEHLQCPTEDTAGQAPILQKPCEFCHAGHDFRFLADLATIGSDIQSIFYTLTATRLLSGDADASFSTGQHFLERLDDWHAQLPPEMRLGTSVVMERRDYFHSGSSAQLKLSFLTLKALVYRAMVRPLTGQVTQSTMFSGRPNASQSNEDARGSTVSGSHGSASTNEDVLQSALGFAKLASQFAQRLNSYDMNSFSRSWSRGCFATISNLILLLLVVAPTAVSAKEVLAVLARWVIIMREQSVMFHNMHLGLLRLDAVFRLGLEKAFSLPAHVRESIQHQLPAPSYQK